MSVANPPQKFTTFLFLLVFAFSSFQVTLAGEFGSYPVPQEIYVFHVSEDGVLAFKPRNTGFKEGCNGFFCTLYRSSSPGGEFEPITTFEQVTKVFSGPGSSAVVNTGSAFPFIWARQQGENSFALFFTNDAGKAWYKVPGTESEQPCPPWRIVQDFVNPQKAYVIPAPGAGSMSFIGDLEGDLPLKDFLETRDGGKHWEKKSLPGKIPAGAEGLIFDPSNS